MMLSQKIREGCWDVKIHWTASLCEAVRVEAILNEMVGAAYRRFHGDFDTVEEGLAALEAAI